MAGRPRAVELSVVQSILEINRDEIIRNGKVIEPSAEIWKKLYNEHKELKKTHCKAIYNDALRWWKQQKTSSSDEEICEGVTEGEFSDETFVNSQSSKSSHENRKSNVHSSNFENKLGYNSTSFNRISSKIRKTTEVIYTKVFNTSTRNLVKFYRRSNSKTSKRYHL